MIDLSFINIEYIVLAMATVILYLLYYVFSRDSEFHKNIRSVASVVDDLNREIFYLKKDLADAKITINNNNSMNDAEIYEEVQRTVHKMVKPLSVGVQRLENTLVSMDEEINLKISSLENGVKQISIPTSSHGNDDQKIISLFKQGNSLDAISKELRISKAEVEFILKINKIK